MTGKNDDAAHVREDAFLARLVPQVVEHLADQHTEDFDTEAGQARFETWLAAHTKKPAAPAEGESGGGTRVISNDAEKVPDRTRHWRLSGAWLTLGGILAGTSAVVVWVAAVGSSSTVLLFLLGALVGVLAGGVVCVRYLRSAIADEIWGYLGERSAAKSRVQLERERNNATQKLILSLPPGAVLIEDGPDWHREIRVPEAFSPAMLPANVMPQSSTPPLSVGEREPAPRSELDPPARNETEPARRQAQGPTDKPN